MAYLIPSSPFFFNDTATTEIYTLSLHDALPIYILPLLDSGRADEFLYYVTPYVEGESLRSRLNRRSEEHTSELQSRLHLVCRLLLEKKNRFNTSITHAYSIVIGSKHITLNATGG